MAHWLDIGGTLNGAATDIYSEGLQIPFLKYQSAGVVNQDLVDIIRMNVRIPSRAMGDLRAQVDGGQDRRAPRQGAARALWPRGVSRRHRRRSWTAREQPARARTRSIPDGDYEAESYMDDDGIEVGRKVPIKVKVVVAGDEMTIDLSDISPQVRGYFNSGSTTGFGCTQVAYKCITSPTDYPVNDGSFRSLKSIVPAGRVVSAVRPAPMRKWMTYPMTVIDTVFKALAPAIPGRVIAGHHADLADRRTSTASTAATRQFFIGLDRARWAAAGAPSASEDGVSATVCINDGDTHNSPNEQTEAKFPLVVESCALIPDSRRRRPAARRARRRDGGARARRHRVQHADRPHPVQAVGPRGRARGDRQRGRGARRRRVARPISPTASSISTGSRTATRCACARAAAAATARRWSGRSKRCAKMCGKAMSRSQPRPRIYGVVVDPVTLALDRDATERLRANHS